jgi:hypothetical protein
LEPRSTAARTSGAVSGLFVSIAESAEALLIVPGLVNFPETAN